MVWKGSRATTPTHALRGHFPQYVKPTSQTPPQCQCHQDSWYTETPSYPSPATYRVFDSNPVTQLLSEEMEVRVVFGGKSVRQLEHQST
jgi:hypothetical protein